MGREYMDGATEEMVTVCVELPAQEMSEARQTEILERTRTAIEADSPSLPGPAQVSAARKPSAEETGEQLDRVIGAWVGSLEGLRAAAERRDPDLGLGPYVPFVHTPNWAYTVDQALQAAWNRVPTALQVPASR